MTIFQEISGVVVVVGAMGAYHWITITNARVASYAERVWPWVSLCFLALAVIAGSQGLKSFTSANDDNALLFIAACLGSLFFAYLSYLAWMSALDQESD